MSKRRNHSASFKTKVALEAIRSEATLPQIADKYKITQGMVSRWKKVVVDGIPKLFDGNNPTVANQKEVKTMQAKIGQLVLEKDFLAQAFSK